MKTLSKSLLICLFPLSAALAQEESASSNTSTNNTSTNTAPTSSLGLSADRTQRERTDFLLNVAQAYMNEKDYSAAVSAYERILEIDPLHQQSKFIVAHIYISAKQYRKAETLLIELTKKYPEDFKHWNNLAWLYATAEDPSIRNGKKAVRFAHEAMTLAPNDYHIWSTLSEAHYISGDYEKAYRAIIHMTLLASRYATDITEESVKEYKEQINKCKRSMDAAKALEENE